jgi:hypothetical protein
MRADSPVACGRGRRQAPLARQPLGVDAEQHRRSLMTLEDKCATGWAANEQAARQHVARVGTRVVTSSRIRLYQKARAGSGFDVGHAEVVIVFASELQNVESSCSDHSSPGGDRFAAPLILVRCRLSRRYPSVRISDGPAVGRGCHRRIEAGPSPLLLPLLHFVPGQLVVVATHPQLPPPRQRDAVEDVLQPLHRVGVALAELQLGHEDLADRNGGVSTGTSRKPRSADLVVVAGRVGALLVVQMWTCGVARIAGRRDLLTSGYGLTHPHMDLAEVAVAVPSVAGFDDDVHREEDVLRGMRSSGPGIGIAMHQIMWARWIEVTRDHERRAAAAYAAISAGETQHLVDELREGLVTFTAAASTVEALYEDTKYLIPERRRKPTAAKAIADALAAALVFPDAERQRLMRDLTYLFDRRNESLHGYSEPRPPEEHPAGVVTGSEASRFNGPECRKALDIALRVLGYAERPPMPANRWVGRWVKERAPYHQQVVKPIRDAMRREE